MSQSGENTYGNAPNGTSHHGGSEAVSTDDHKNGESKNDEAGAAWTLGEGARATASALRDAYRGASAAVSDIGGEAYQMGSKTSAQIARSVEAQPMTSVLLAASLGLVAGVLLARR